MKVAFIAEWLDASRGGAETSALQFLNELTRRDVALTVISRSSQCSIPDVRFVQVEARGLGRASRSDAFLRRAGALAKSCGADVIHSIVPCEGVDVYQPRGGLVAETITRTVASREGWWAKRVKQLDLRLNMRQRMLLNRERQLLTGRSKPMVAALSNYVVRQLREHFDFPDSRLRLIFNGVTVPSFNDAQKQGQRLEIRRRFAISDDEILLLFVGHHFRLKGLHVLLRAIRWTMDRAVGRLRLLVVGGGASRSWLRRVAGEGLGEIVRFSGPAGDVMPFFHAADVLVHPSFYDPCSRVVLEAYSQGLPIISSRFDGASEIIVDNLSGYVLESLDDIARFADRITELTLAENRRRMIAAMMNQPCDLSMTRHVDEMIRLYAFIRRSHDRG